MHPMNGDVLDDDDLHSERKDALETNGVASDDDGERCNPGEANADDIETCAMKMRAVERGVVAFMMVSDRVTAEPKRRVLLWRELIYY